jgi:hypothetical protein
MCTGPRRSAQTGGLTAADLLDVEDALIRQARGEGMTARAAALVARAVEEGHLDEREVDEDGERVAVPTVYTAPHWYAGVEEFERPPTVAPGWEDAPTGPVEYHREGEGPAAAHLSSDTSRSAYAAAGALRDAGNARDDDLAWPFDWGRPTPMLVDEEQVTSLVERGGYDREDVEAHAPVYAPGTMPERSDEDWAFPSAPLSLLPMSGCGCSTCTLLRAAERVGVGLAGVAEAYRQIGAAVAAPRFDWAAMVERISAAMGVPRSMVAGTAADPLAGLPGGLSRFEEQAREDMRAYIRLWTSSPDEPGARSVAEWTGRAGLAASSITFDELAGSEEFATGSWDAVITPEARTAALARQEAARGIPGALRLDREPCEPVEAVDTPRVEWGVDLGPYGDADLVEALRQGEVVTLFRDGSWGGSYRTEAMLALRGANVFRPDRMITVTNA